MTLKRLILFQNWGFMSLKIYLFGCNEVRAASILSLAVSAYVYCLRFFCFSS